MQAEDRMAKKSVMKIGQPDMTGSFQEGLFVVVRMVDGKVCGES
jgi:hypothetical protein